jgi:hypothetical protein
MTFELKPGDYILTSEIPFDKRQLVIDAFMDAGAVIFDGHDFHDTIKNWDRIGWCPDENHLEMWSKCFEMKKGYRRVTLSQILGDGPSWDEIGPKLLDALRLIANGDGSYGAQAWEYKQIARHAISKAEGNK